MPHLFPGITRRGSAACGMQDFVGAGGRWQRGEERGQRSEVTGEMGRYTQRMWKWGDQPGAKILGIKEMNPPKQELDEHPVNERMNE